jgi:hypothetical protein
VAGSCEHGNEPSGCIEGGGDFLTSCEIITFSGRTFFLGVI